MSNPAADRREIERVAARLAAVEAEQRRARTAGLRYSSIEGGELDVLDDDGALRMRVGAQDDGTVAITSYGGDAPPTPAPPVVLARPQAITVAGIGLPMSGEWPADTAAIELHVSTTDPDYTPDVTTIYETFPPEPGQAVTVAGAPTVAHHVRLVAVSTSGQRSAPTASVTGTPEHVAVVETGTDVNTGRVWLGDYGVVILAPGQTAAAGTTDYSIWLSSAGSAWYKKDITVGGNLFVDGTMSIRSGSTSYIDNGGRLLSLGQPFDQPGVYSLMSGGYLECGRWTPGTNAPKTKLRPSAIEFENASAQGAGYLSSSDGRMTFNSRTDLVLQPGDGAVAAVQLNAGALFAVQGLPDSSTGTPVVVSPSGIFYRSTSSERYKTDVEPVAVGEHPILDVKVVRHRNRAAVEAYDALAADAPYVAAPPPTHVGVIAEQLDELGLGEVVVYDEQGRPDAVQYDRLAMLMLPVLQDLAGRVADLEQRLADGDA